MSCYEHKFQTENEKVKNEIIRENYHIKKFRYIQIYNGESFLFVCYFFFISNKQL